MEGAAAIWATRRLLYWAHVILETLLALAEALFTTVPLVLCAEAVRAMCDILSHGKHWNDLILQKKKKEKKKKEEKPGAVPRKKIWGGQMDLAAQWKTRPGWLESKREKCRSNNWDWSGVHKHELCQLDVSTLPCGLDTFPINILKMCERSSLCVCGTVDRTPVLCCNTFCFSFTWCITYKNSNIFSPRKICRKSRRYQSHTEKNCLLC